ncbi:MAG TPA: ROK family protein [Chryseosolibacter sp.]
MKIWNDERIVMTLDAGGTNFVFSAVQGGKEIVSPITFAANAHDLQLCLKTMIKGFESIRQQLHADPVAISFAFPGPADYKAGIIGKLPNLPAFTGEGVAMGPMLEDYFGLPTFINNDGNLFAYGEALAGTLPMVNRMLAERNVQKQYSNLLGVTLGTGFGAGFVVNNELCDGDNSAGGEIWLTRNFRNLTMMSEGHVSIRAVQKNFAALAGLTTHDLSPQDIYEIAMGLRPGNQHAAKQVFHEMAEVVAESLCHAITMIDGIIVIGGGMAGAYPLIVPKIIEHMNGTICNLDGVKLQRLVSEVYDLEDETSREKFLTYQSIEISVPFSDRKIPYIKEKRIGICRSKLGTSRAISLGAYAIALQKLKAGSLV